MPRTGFTVGVFTIGVVGWLVLPLHARDQAREGRKLQLEQFFDFETVSNPRISPDGTQIVYTRGWVDKVNDRRSSALWIMGADGSKNRLLTTGSNAIWSPDGTRIAFTRDGEPSGSQIWVRWMDAEGRDHADHPSRTESVEYHLGAGRQVGRVHHARPASRDVADSHAGASRGREVDRGAAHRREPDVPRGSAGLHRAGPESDLHACQPKAVPSAG